MYSLLLAVFLGLMPVSAMAKSLLVFGDSISAGYGIDVELGWVNLLRQKFNQLQMDPVIHNESISGDTSAGGLSRIDQALAKHQPDIVMLELGANDGLRGLSPQQMKSNLTEMIRRCRQIGAEVLLLGMKLPPNYGKRFVDMFYNVYPQLAEELNVPLVPFILEDVALKPELMQLDGLHPNASGQAAIVETIWPYLQPLLN